MKQNLIGCFEILLFMRSGIERFQAVSRINAFRSFLIPITLLPLTFAVLVVTSKEGYSIPFIISVHFVRIVIGFFVYLTIVYFLSRQLERQEHFYRFLVITNWTSLYDIVLISPIYFYVITVSDVSGIEPYAVFTTLLCYVYASFVITHSFRVPWQIGGFIAIVGLAVDEVMWNALFFTCGNITAIHGT